VSEVIRSRFTKHTTRYLHGPKPRPEPPALAFSCSEPGQSHCWAVTNGLAWPGPNRLGLAWLTALGRAWHITMIHNHHNHQPWRVSNTAYSHHQIYALCIMHYAPYFPASHGGSNAKAMQDENYASSRHAL
jgi:hypothetical protein